MKTKDTPLLLIIEVLNDFCIRTGIHVSDSQELIGKTMQDINGNVYFEIIQQTFREFINGQIDVKPPYKINNLFISQLLYRHFELRRQSKKDYEPEQEIKPTEKEIEQIYSLGLTESRIRLINFLKGENTYFDPFFLFNEYQWLTLHGLDPNNYEETDIEKMAEKFQRYDKMKFDGNGYRREVYTPTMTRTDYAKAAVVALYLTT